MSEIQKQTLDDDYGKQSIKRMADFFDCGLYLLYCRQGDKPSEKGKLLVEAVTADKIFRLLHKLSNILCVIRKKNTDVKDIDFPDFDVRIGLDLNGMHGKGIAFPLKYKAPNVVDISDEDINELDINEGQNRKPPLFSCSAIEYLEKLSFPPPKRRLSVEMLSDGRRAYSSIVGQREFEEWRKNGRFDEKNTDLILEFKSFINRLEDRELICLGRHENVKDTINAVEHLFKRWKDGLDIALKRVEKLHHEKKWPEEEDMNKLKKLYNYTQEMIFKSEVDKEYYEKAYEELKKETHPALKKLLENQSPADIIWGSSSEVKRYVYFGYLFHTFTSFLFLALASHPSSKYYTPKYITSDVNYELLPSLVDNILKEDRMTKISYSSENYQKIIRSLSTSKLTNGLFNFDSFRKGDLSIYINYFKNTQVTIWQEYTKFIGKKKRSIERLKKT